MISTRAISSKIGSKSKLRSLAHSCDDKSYIKLPRLYINDLLNGNTIVRLPKEDSHYVVNVMRMKSGSTLRAFNPNDGEYLAELNCNQRDATVRIISQIRAPLLEGPVFPGVLFFAPIKKTRMKILLEKATELGVEHLVPVITQNTQFPIEASSLETYRKQCIQSAEQCERMTLPVLHSPVSISELLGGKAPKSDSLATTQLFDLPLLICAERLASNPGGEMGSTTSSTSGATYAALPFLSAVQNLLRPSTVNAITADQTNKKMPSFGVVVGPEGGFTKEEIEKLAALNRAQLVSLGSNVLRAETASIAALSVISCVVDSI